MGLPIRPLKDSAQDDYAYYRASMRITWFIRPVCLGYTFGCDPQEAGTLKCLVFYNYDSLVRRSWYWNFSLISWEMHFSKLPGSSTESFHHVFLRDRYIFKLFTRYPLTFGLNVLRECTSNFRFRRLQSSTSLISKLKRDTTSFMSMMVVIRLCLC